MTEAYNASYTGGDIANVVIDLLVGVGAGVFSFVSLVALVFIYRWFSENV